MHLPNYPLTSSDTLMTFEFNSVGPNGLIQKVIRYEPTLLNNVFNLAFGDKNRYNQMDDLSISNNGDSEKILATVVVSVILFTNRYRRVWIYASGSTKSRTRLYRMGITKFLNEISIDFQLLGYRNDCWEPFRKNVDYDSFLLSKKDTILPFY